MTYQFPLRLVVTKATPHAAELVEIEYDIVDSASAVVKHDYFNCKPLDIVEVCGYTLERFSLALAQPNKAAALDRVFGLDEALAEMRSSTTESSEIPAQTISPPGVGGSSRANK